MPTITLSDFENTEIAFRHKTNEKLKQANQLFSTMKSPWLVKTGSALVSWGLKNNLPIEGLVKRMLFDQFCGGTSLDDIGATIKELAQYNVFTILDYSVEGEKNENGFDACALQTVRSLQFAAKYSEIPYCALKITGIAPVGLLEKIAEKQQLSLTEEGAWNRVQERLRNICEVAANTQKGIYIDAEETWIQPAIEQLTETMMFHFNKEQPIVYQTLQLYRHDRLPYLKDLKKRCQQADVFLAVKLVRGAYLETEIERAKQLGYPNPIQPNKEATDKDFNECLSVCITDIQKFSLCSGTHNEVSALELVNLMEKQQINPSDTRIVFAQLLGMSDHITFNLAKAGYRTAKYVPYGPVKSVLPYLFRRAEENTAITGQTNRELRLIQQELKRRKIT
ncbi:MAG: proline dehydrogenase family protein [Bacteroidia bacterium]|nr:proline dehydrogenase family protein [Bacteroidia bacterium]